jgi:hypothetical protein
MVGYIASNRYQPRAKWKDKLDGWVQNPPPNVGSWQVDISLYWRWRTLQGMSVMDAWTQLRMQPNNAATSLHPHSVDRGLIPPELFSRVLARSRATATDPNDDVAGVIIDPEPAAATAAAEDDIEIGYTPPNEYRPRAKWRNKLDTWVQFPPPNVGSWQVDISLYWRWRTLQGMSLMDAWTQLRMHPNNAATSLHPNGVDRGLVPPELFSRVLARSQAATIDPNDDVAGVIIHPEPTA